MDADNQDVLGGLGVTARPAEDVESDLLAKVYLVACSGLLSLH